MFPNCHQLIYIFDNCPLKIIRSIHSEIVLETLVKNKYEHFTRSSANFEKN